MPEDLKDQNGSKKGLTALLDEVKGEVKVLKEKGVEDVKALQDPGKDPALQVHFPRQTRRQAAQPCFGSALQRLSCTFILPRSTATRWRTTIPGEWAASRSTSLWC